MQNTEKGPRDLTRLAIIQTPVKDHQFRERLSVNDGLKSNWQYDNIDNNP